MRNSHNGSFSQPRTTWILVANRSGARLLQTQGNVQQAVPIKDFQHPRGRLKGHEMETDRDGAGSSEGGANSQVHGLVNKGGYRIHVLQQFAHELCDTLNRGRAENHYRRLILVAEPKLLGQIRHGLEPSTTSRITHSLGKDFTGVSEKDLRNRLEALVAR